MRKLIAVVAVLGLVLIGLKFAEAISPLSKTYISVNNTGGDVANTVSTSTIVPGEHKILSFTVIPIEGSSAGGWATLYSGPTAQSNIIGEAETLANKSKDKIFPYPKAVKAEGITITQSAYTVVLIDYTR